MSARATVYGAEGCGSCERTCRALELAGISFERVDVWQSGFVDELRGRGIRELPFVTTSTGEGWTGLRVDRIVELRRAGVEQADADEPL